MLDPFSLLVVVQKDFSPPFPIGVVFQQFSDYAPIASGKLTRLPDRLSFVEPESYILDGVRLFAFSPHDIGFDALGGS